MTQVFEFPSVRVRTWASNDELIRSTLADRGMAAADIEKVARRAKAYFDLLADLSNERVSGDLPIPSDTTEEVRLLVADCVEATARLYYDAFGRVVAALFAERVGREVQDAVNDPEAS